MSSEKQLGKSQKLIILSFLVVVVARVLAVDASRGQLKRTTLLVRWSDDVPRSRERSL